MVLASQQVPDLHMVGAASGTQCLPLYRYTTDGERVDNITDWAVEQFRARYGSHVHPQPPTPSPTGRRGARLSSPTGRGAGGEGEISKQDIFHYVYAVLHHPAYREKYALNLKREFPRIPFYDDFWQWAAWGKQLLDLHLNYEQVKAFKLKREDKQEDPKGLPNSSGLKPRLIARKDTGVIEIDSITTLRGVPSEVWDYRLGTYCAIDWVLERYKERTPQDPTIREKFNTYHFADYKEQVIDLLGRVCTVSIETMKIIAQMPK
jgi:predicted helicase